MGGEELIRVVVPKTNNHKIAHKIDKMGDYKPEIVYENASVVKVDPRDDAAVAKINSERAPQLVTVKEDVDLPVIVAFRLLAAIRFAGCPRNRTRLSMIARWRPADAAE